MPWCEECSKFWTPSTMAADGTCPACGHTIAEPKVAPRAPWHFKLMVLAVTLYLGWRVVQAIGWVL